ncbi:MAG TPA: FHA domain-containing protein, partial [Urbifossiella sp.]|nr:FHA domain-containing protein [Urbifossiella sp.]
MEHARIVVSGPGVRPGQPARSWSSTAGLRVGRLPDLEVVFDDDTVSRVHAELVPADDGWLLRDLGSSNGTFVNGGRIGRTGRQVRKGDAVAFGRIVCRVEVAVTRPQVRIQASGQVVRVQSASERTWDEAVAGLDPTPDQWDRHGRSLLGIMREGYRLAHAPNLDVGLREVLADAVRAFSAQRGGVFLLDRPDG